MVLVQDLLYKAGRWAACARLYQAQPQQQHIDAAVLALAALYHMVGPGRARGMLDFLFLFDQFVWLMIHFEIVVFMFICSLQIPWT